MWAEQVQVSKRRDINSIISYNIITSNRFLTKLQSYCFSALYRPRSISPWTGRQEWSHCSTILEESHPNTILWHLIPNNLGLRIFSEEASGSNDGPYCPLYSYKKLEKSLEPFWKKGQKSQRTPFLATRSPIICDQESFQKKMSGSNNVTHCPQQLCEKLGRSLGSQEPWK